MKRVENTSLSLAPVFLGQCIVFSMDVNNIVLMKMLKTMLLHLAAHLQCIIAEKKSFRFKLVYTSDGCHPILPLLLPTFMWALNAYMSTCCIHQNKGLGNSVKTVQKLIQVNVLQLQQATPPTHQSTQL